MKPVYCCDCKWLKRQANKCYHLCRHPNNIFVSNYWFGFQMKYKSEPQERNGWNNCELYEPTLFARLKAKGKEYVELLESIVN
jgi:hypothetical protein